jgi:acyl carrier protein
MSSMTLADLRTLVGLQLGQPNIDETAHIVEELGAESADILNIILAVEDKYRVHIADSDMSKVRTTSDLYKLIQRLRGEA